MSLLSSTHREHLRASGLTDDTIMHARIRTLARADEAAELLNWRGEKGPVPAIAFPQFDRSGQVCGCVLRPDAPRARADGSRPKYESPIGVGPRVYFPPAPLVSSCQWEDVGTPLVIIEGIKKALCAVQAGALAVSAQGTTVWHDIQERRASGAWELHPDFAGIPFVGRTVFIGFDGGDTSRNVHVILAEARLAFMLRKQRARARLLRIPSGDNQKVGLDDYLAKVADPTGEVSSLCGAAVEGDAVERAKAASAEVLRTLLDDLSFAAALHVDGVAIDLSAPYFKKVGIQRKRLEEARDKFRARLRAVSTTAKPEVVTTDPAEEKAVDALLRDPRLVERFLLDVELDGLVGEKDAALAVLLASVSRRTPKPIHIVVKGTSSAGKNHLVQKVLDFLPKTEVLALSTLTPSALYYLEGGLTGKVVVITEAEGAERTEYSLRVAMSEGELVLLTPEREERDGKFVSRERRVAGPACFITTTTRARMHDENETRVLELVLDESAAQSKRIVAAQARRAAGLSLDALATDRKSLWRSALGTLDHIPVIVPQAVELAARQRTERVRVRRDFSRLLSLVTAHALLHQRQRTRRGAEIVASDLDVAAAVRLASALIHGVAPRLRELHRRLLDELGGSVFTPAEAARVLGQEPRSAQRNLADLAGVELALCIEEHRGSNPSRWRVLSADAHDVLGHRPVSLVASGNADAPCSSDSATVKSNNPAEWRPILTHEVRAGTPVAVSHEPLAPEESARPCDTASRRAAPHLPMGAPPVTVEGRRLQSWASLQTPRVATGGPTPTEPEPPAPHGPSPRPTSHSVTQCHSRTTRLR